jgi:aspartate kinase
MACLKELFEVFERYSLSADLVSTSEASISIALDSAAVAGPFVSDLKAIDDVEVETGKSIVCLVSSEIKNRVGVAASVFGTLAEAKVNIHMISQGASEINIGVVIEESAMPEAIRHLHARFFEQAQPLSAAAMGGETK